MRAALVGLTVTLLVGSLALAADPPAKASKPAAASGWGVKSILPASDKLPRVLLVGDSILGGYHGKAAELLRGRVGLDVWITPKHIGNKDLAKDMEGIFGAAKYDLVLFNDIGLHAWTPGRIPEGQYEPLMRAHLANYKRYAGKATLIWASTTPMTTKTKPIELDAEFNPLIVQRNAICAKIMQENQVPVADYYGILVGKLDLAAGDRFHWSRPAYELLAQEAARQITAALKLDTPSKP